MKTPIGLDLSLTSTGVSCDGVTSAIQVKTNGPQRMIDIVCAVLNKLPNDPLAIIEGFSFGSKNSRAHEIGGLGWYVRVQLYERGIPYIDVPPTVLKRFATGKGNAGKSEVVSAVSARTGLVWTGNGADDMCDAWVLEEIGLFLQGRSRFEWPALNTRDIADKIDKTYSGW